MLSAAESTSPAGLVALVAGALVGALVRLLLARAVGPQPRRSAWFSESAVGLLLGAALATPVVLMAAGVVVASSLGGALTAYCGACAAYGFIEARATGARPLPATTVRLLTAAAATSGGFLGVIGLWTAVT